MVTNCDTEDERFKCMLFMWVDSKVLQEKEEQNLFERHIRVTTLVVV